MPGQLLGKKIDERLDAKLRKYPEIYSGYWSKYSVTIPKRLSEISGLGWKETSVTCYLVGKHRSFSDPLSITAYEKEGPFLDALTHELIHRLVHQNQECLPGFWNWLKQKYPEESQLALNHVPVFAMQKALYIDVFGENRAELQRTKPVSIKDDYSIAWEIVDNEGYVKIIKMMENSQSEQA